MISHTVPFCGLLIFTDILAPEGRRVTTAQQNEWRKSALCSINRKRPDGSGNTQRAKIPRTVTAREFAQGSKSHNERCPKAAKDDCVELGGSVSMAESEAIEISIPLFRRRFRQFESNFNSSQFLINGQNDCGQPRGDAKALFLVNPWKRCVHLSWYDCSFLRIEPPLIVPPVPQWTNI